MPHDAAGVNRVRGIEGVAIFTANKVVVAGEFAEDARDGLDFGDLKNVQEHQCGCAEGLLRTLARWIQ
jgi:hypothetical protein